MSGLVKGVKKVFKKVVKVVKKILPYVAMGAAVYFTAGLALSALPATASFAASLPGFAGAGGSGIFGLAAASSGAAGGAAAAGAGAVLAEAPGLAGATSAAAMLGGGASAGLTTASGAAATAALAANAAGGGAAAGGFIGRLASTWKALPLTDKLMLASTGTQALSAFMAPTEAEQADAIAAAQAKFRGAFYGVEANGQTTPVPYSMEPPPSPTPPAQAHRPVNELVPPVSGKAVQPPQVDVPGASMRSLFSAAQPDAAGPGRVALPQIRRSVV